MNVFLSIFVLFYTLIPLTNLKLGDFDFENYSFESDTFTEESYENIVSSSIEEVCSQNSIGVISTNIDSYIKDNYLCIKKIVVKIDNPEKAKYAEKIIRDELGYEVTIN